MASASDDAILGTGLALVDGDLLFSGGDLAPVSGRANFGQAVQVIVGTPFASDIFNVTYGLDVGAIFSVAASVSSIKDVIRLNLVKSLSTDDRIQQIQQILFDDEPGFAGLAPEFGGGDPGSLARRTRAWHAVIALTTMSGAQQQTVISGPAP